MLLAPAFVQLPEIVRSFPNGLYGCAVGQDERE